MTVKELIMSVTFEDLLPILKESDDSAESVPCVAL